MRNAVPESAVKVTLIRKAFTEFIVQFVFASDPARITIVLSVRRHPCRQQILSSSRGGDSSDCFRENPLIGADFVLSFNDGLD